MNLNLITIDIHIMLGGENNENGIITYSTVVSAEISFKELLFSILESFKEANLLVINTYDYYSIYNPNDYLKEFEKNYSYYLEKFIPDFYSHINEVKNLKQFKTEFYNFCDSYIKNLNISLMNIYNFYKEQGYILDFSINFPWLYLTLINNKPVNIIYNSEHGCTIGFLTDQYSRIKSIDVSIIDKLIRSKNYESDI